MRKPFLALCTIALAFVLLFPVQAVWGDGVLLVLPHKDGKPIKGGSITLYHVGTPGEGGYHLTDGLANWMVRDTDACSTEFAQWIVSRLDSSGITIPVKNDKGVEFSGLEAGLYLVMQTECAPLCKPFSPFLVSLPAEGNQWYLEAKPKVDADTGENPDTGEGKIPLFLTLLPISLGAISLFLGKIQKIGT